LVTPDEIKDFKNNPKEGLFSHTDDFISLTEVARAHPSIHEILIKDRSHYDSLIEETNNDKDIIPLFIKDLKGNLEIISSHNISEKEVSKGSSLVYLGKLLSV
jgi:hypothetical protein